MSHPADVLRAAGRRALHLLRRAGDVGASAIEMAVIAAVLVVAASVIGAIVYNGVTTKGNTLQTCINAPAGTQCSP